MSTVTCSNCKSQNTEGSKFCNNCGAALPLSTHITCPNCQVRNPRNLLYCDNCGTRLLPIGELSSEREEEKPPKPESREAPKAFSLPAREPGNELDQNQLLDWLRTGEEQPEGEGGQEATTSEENVLGDWLNELTENDPADSEAEDTDWFADSGESSQEESAVPDLSGWFADSESGSEEEDLSDWLSELEGSGEEEPELPDNDVLLPTKPPPSKADFTNTLNVPPPFPDDDDDEILPDWLSEFGDDSEEKAESAEEIDLSDWSSDLPPAEEAPTSSQFTSETTEEEQELPDWLGGFDSEEAPETLISATPQETDEDEEDLPDWLSSFESEEESPTLISSTPEEAAEEQEELPDWLSGFDSEEESPTIITSFSEETEEEDEPLPDWLSGFDAYEEMPTLVSATPADADDDDEDLPDWLSDLDYEEESPELPTTPTKGITDWLSDPDLEESPYTESESIEPEAEEASFSDWLQELKSEEPVLNAEAGSEETADEVIIPDWLDDFDDEDEQTALGLPEAEEEFEELPDWLDDLEGVEATEVDGVFAGETVQINEERDEYDDLIVAGPELKEESDDPDTFPDWLLDLSGEGTADDAVSQTEQEETAAYSPISEQPDWLTDVVPASNEIEEEPLQETTDSEEDDLADWLSDLSAVDESFDPDEDTDWFEALTQEESWPELAEEEEIAAQLEETEEEPVKPNKPSKELKGVPKELVSSGLPDWLQDDMPEDFDEDDYFEDEDEPIVAGELPDWLQEMKPPDMGEAGQRAGLGAGFAMSETQDEWQKIFQNTPPSEQGMGPGAAELSSAEIPAWLQSLRPREVGEEVEEVESDEPAVTEGPLAGLRGVLPVAPTITEPAAAKTAVQYTISKEQQQQISLLHQLTHEEPAKTKQIAQKKSATFSGLWRTILGFLLFAAVLAGVLLPSLDVGLPETALPVSQTTLDTFNVVDPLVGRPVLVAFDYTPLMAAELDPIALMLLRQLAANGNRILTISQSAAGTAIADQRVSEVDNLDSQSLGLLPGEAVGLRSLGNCLNSADNCAPLFGGSDAAIQSDLADLGLIIILTSDRNSLINWVEQVESQTDTPVIAAVAQPIGPLTLPYLSSGQLEGTVDGIPNASAYEKRLLGQDGEAFQQFTAQTIVMWLVIIGLITATVVYGLAGVARRDKKKGNG